MKVKSKDIISLICAMSVLLISFFTEQLYFDIKPTSDYMIQNYIIAKVGLFFLVFAFVQILTTNIQGAMLKLKECKMFLISFCILLLLYCTYLLFLWPGLWGWDGFTILQSTDKYSMLLWTSWLTSFIYFVSMMILPFPTGVLIMQIIISSMIIARMVQLLYRHLGFKRRTCIIILPFLLPPSLILILSPIRTYLFALLIIYVFFEVYFNYKDKSQLTIKQLIYIGFLLGICSSWRGEGIIMTLFIPLIIFIFIKKIPHKHLIIFFISSIFMVFMFKQLQPSSYQYMINNLYYPVQQMVQTKNLKSPSLEQDLNKINKVYNVNVMLDSYSDPSGCFSQDKFAYGKEGFAPELATEDDYHEMLIGFKNLVIYNLPLFLDIRWKTFVSGAIQGDYSISDFSNYDKEVGSSFNFPKYHLTKQKNINLSNKILDVTTNFKVANIEFVHIKLLLKSIWIPLIGLILGGIICLLKKEYLILFMIIIYGGMTIGSILIEPFGQFMYFFPEYIGGYTMILLIILKAFPKSPEW